jgi:flagellin-like protein
VHYIKKYSNWLHNKRALSPIFATLILAAIVITFGSVAYYYANNVVTNSTNNYVSSVADSQQTISERVGFESAKFIAADTSNSPNPITGPTLTVYLQVNAILLEKFDNNHKLISTTPCNIEANTHTNAPSYVSFTKINDGVLKPLNVGQEGYFTIKLPVGTTLTSGYYSIQLLTKSGSSFEYAP